MMWRPLQAEFIGTDLLVTVIVGSGIAAQQLSPEDAGPQLLENSTATAFRLAVLRGVGVVVGEGRGVLRTDFGRGLLEAVRAASGENDIGSLQAASSRSATRQANLGRSCEMTDGHVYRNRYRTTRVSRRVGRILPSTACVN
jgi:hypothetical protein